MKRAIGPRHPANVHFSICASEHAAEGQRIGWVKFISFKEFLNDISNEIF